MMVSGIIAEMGNAHNGSLTTAHKIIEACAKAGVDWMKFQCYLPKELVSLRGDGPAPKPWQKYSMYELYEKAQTPHSWFPSLKRKCEEVGIPWFSSVFGTDSLAMLEKIGCPAYKLASLDVEQDVFRKLVIATGKPVIQSAPDFTHIKGVTQLYCPPGYPQHFSEADMGLFFPPFDGFSYHGTDWKVPKLALKRGAKIVEVHVQLDSEPSELEASCCLNISDLYKLIGKPKRKVRK